MDVEENYESQNATESQDQHQHPHQHQHQQQQQLQLQLNLQQQQQQMQCEPFFGLTTNTTTTTNPMMETNSIAIPLPAPPGTTGSVVVSSSAPASLPASSPAAPHQQKGLPTNDFDIDSLLLQQFSCMGTTDHEDLISQFQSLMNNQMNRESARFYLEMSNWSLQTAVGCYLDFCSLQSLPSMKIVQGQHVNAQQQAFQLQNDGTERWPNNCYLTSPIQTQRINIPSLRPGETCDILADLMPTQPPIMWRLCTPNGWYFGDAIWMIPPGTQASQDELQQRMVQLITSEAKPEVYPQINIVITAHTH
ncbi:protein ILRUN [Drosophila pseudoobscura]|uniref:Protein ILRUN n=1 Tax=Drosophila pseudoobscura pseudoobscura TaxID=46245 RepID=A0A6I8UFE9_DROPS|nr:protein ILRUN [Drosophila pseudoobscura]